MRSLVFAQRHFFRIDFNLINLIFLFSSLLSIRSASSTSSSSRSAEGVAIRQPSKNRIRRHTNRLSGVFLRVPSSGSGSMALTAGIRSSLSIQPRKADDPSELSNQITAPGILKIFGNDICEGAHYKSVLATTHSSAKELVKEALERYGLGKREAESYVLCDTIGSIGNQQWKTEGFRVVGDNEKPLLLQSLWKPREGLARRFELQKRSSVEEKTSKDKDTITAGINAQARKLQKSRSRVTSTFMERTMGRNHKMLRSKSEMDLLDSDAENQQDRKGEESEREETESSDESNTQFSIHPPHDCPYLLLLQGCSPAQDFVIYLLAGQNIVFGRQSDIEDGSKPDIILFAADILPRHCYFHRHSVGSPTMIGPCQDATVMKNGQVLREEVQLNPGDVIGLGQCYLFLFKDPLALTPKVRVSPISDTKRGPIDYLGPPVLKSPKGHSLTLKYETEDEYRIVKEILSIRSSIKDRRPLTASFLLCLCVQYSSASLHTSDLRRLLLLIAIHKPLPDMFSCFRLNTESSNSEDLQDLALHEVMSGLHPLVVWMSNSLELLHFIQFQLPLILEWRTRKEQGLEEETGGEDEEIKELRLSCIRSASEETLAVLEEVLLLAFQQCVYYTTKVLYPILGSPELEVLTETWKLLSDCQLHAEISSQLIGYLFYFINASLFNSLMERGITGFFQWSQGVRMRSNLNVLLDWAHTAGLGELILLQVRIDTHACMGTRAHTHTHTHTHHTHTAEAAKLIVQYLYHNIINYKNLYLTLKQPTQGSRNFYYKLSYCCCAAVIKIDLLSLKRKRRIRRRKRPKDHYDDKDYELFSLELERGACGVGLALIDTRGERRFIRAVVPDSPAARCEKLLLLGMDYQSGKELIQSSGDRLRLLVARSEWMSKAIKADC
uniref:Uncharacterized protein n=1 Tax=Labrus bergylta TaxID=56723 RepID=A0A3Q3N7Q2_9LABR